jgi:hypothetical protein
MSAGPADKRFSDEVTNRERVEISILSERVELVALLAMLDPNFSVA